MRLGILGASGYVGREVVAAAAGAWSLVVMGRTSVGTHEFRACDLGKPLDPAVIDGLTAVIHLAADTGGGGHDAADEIAFTRALAEEAARRGVRLVFVSSQVADVHAPSDYGRRKAAIERDVLERGGVVVRPGLVYGGREAGLFGQLVGLVRRLPVLPGILPAPRVWPVHVRDLAQALIHACDPVVPSAVYGIAGAPVGFDVFLAAIGRYRWSKRRVFLPFPAVLLRAALAVAGPVLGPRFSAARFDSLLAVPPMQAAEGCRQLGVVPRPLHAGMSRSGR
ncbi:MAG TPA: NAD-dependent epimerase/dehydratase family protein, partial [Lysobacter sp.]|nr:NAD-dependent epimerase/dehydratase family protein [Lysobacter sp.]